MSFGVQLEASLELGHTWALLDGTLWLDDTQRVTGAAQSVELGRFELLRSFPQHTINYSALGELVPVHEVADLTVLLSAGVFVRFWS